MKDKIAEIVEAAMYANACKEIDAVLMLNTSPEDIAEYVASTIARLYSAGEEQLEPEEEIYDKATKYAEENYADRNQHWDVIDGFIAGFKGSSCIISENDIAKAIEGYSSPLSIRNRKEYESWRDGLAKAIKELLNR